MTTKDLAHKIAGGIKFGRTGGIMLSYDFYSEASHGIADVYGADLVTGNQLKSFDLPRSRKAVEEVLTKFFNGQEVGWLGATYIGVGKCWDIYYCANHMNGFVYLGTVSERDIYIAQGGEPGMAR